MANKTEQFSASLSRFVLNALIQVAAVDAIFLAKRPLVAKECLCRPQTRVCQCLVSADGSAGEQPKQPDAAAAAMRRGLL